MAETKLDEIRALVVRPSRYLGTEINAQKKRHDAVKLRCTLAFPDLYDIGTSHLGMQTLYHILNRQPDVVAERVFMPGLDLADRLRRDGEPLFSLETGTPLKNFDLIGFSLLYELNYTNVLAMLDLAGIAFRADQREASDPLIVAGGPCTCNPEPMAEFFDAMVVGDGESVIRDMARCWIDWSESGQSDRKRLLSAWAAIEGVYIPSFFEPDFDSDGFVRLAAESEDYPSVRRAIVADLDAAEFSDKPIVPFGKPVHDRLRIEVARGCTRGCRFCQAGMIYRPVRERALANLQSLAEKALAATGYDDISLLSLSTGDYSCLTPLMQDLIEKHRADPVAVSIPSFRAGSLTPEMMALVKKVRKTGFTIAPEAGSERLRRVINKNITEDEILDTVHHAFSLGWKVIKLYFMIGLPTETPEDIDAIVTLVDKIRRKKGIAGKNARINVSVATFIPKPHTPFQWQPQLPVDRAWEIIHGLREQLKMPGVQFKWQNPEVSLLEGLWARGDRRLGALLQSAYHKGCLFDGWSDCFDFSAWQAACRETGIDVGFFLHRQRSYHEPLPWDSVDCRIKRDFLWAEQEKAVNEAFTADCRFGECSVCGVCDFSSVRPRFASEISRHPSITPAPEYSGDNAGGDFRVRMRYAKLGPARYFGHLELVNLFTRALRRAGLPMKYSRGFHPKPKISFHEAIPVGIESEREEFFVTLCREIDCGQASLTLNRDLPEGLTLLDCAPVSLKSGPVASPLRSYEIIGKDGAFPEDQFNAFVAAARFPLERRNAKNKLLEIDLKEVVVDIFRAGSNQITLQLLHQPGKTLRPGEAVQAIFGLSTEGVNRLHIVKKQAKT